jgi:hypothetical protein
MWYDEFNSVFWTGIATMVVAGVGLLVRYTFRSKCDNVTICFGCVRVHRVVELEEGEPDADEEQKDEDAEFKNP